MSPDLEIEICIIGAGPTGCTASYFLSAQKIKHILLDKAIFPRDKTCGDGLSIEVLHTLQNIKPSLIQAIKTDTEHFTPVEKVDIYSANGTKINLDFDHAPMYNCKRAYFDHFLHQYIDHKYCTLLTNEKVIDLNRHNKTNIITTNKRRISTQLLIGADGDQSIVSKFVKSPKKPKVHNYASLRAYYKNIKTNSHTGQMEFYFDKTIAPGYFWIFQLPNNTFNVGLVAKSSDIQIKDISLKTAFQNIIQNKLFKDRFADAEIISTPKGWNLPLNSHKKPLAYDGILLIGDAGSLVEPFTGKGIGTGMISAKIAIEAVIEARKKQDYSKSLLMNYEVNLRKNYEKEWTGLLKLQEIYSKPWKGNLLHQFLKINWIQKRLDQKINQEINKWI